MKVLVVGSGGREHALAWGLAKSPQVSELWTTSDNAGICSLAKCADIEGSGTKQMAAWAQANQIDFTIVGPEAPLSTGVVDEFTELGLKIFGPTKAAAELEGSKAFAKELMVRNGIPTAAFAICESPQATRSKAREFGLPVVIKADGLAAGKGVAVCQSWEEVEEAVETIMVEKIFGEAGERVVVEEFLTGEEASVHALVSGTDFLVMPAAQDHKAAFNGDTGPNTGGMGTYSPAPVVDAKTQKIIENQVIRPTVEAMAAAGRPFSGTLFTGLMIGEKGPKVLEYNCRFGDPETQVIIPRLQGDLLELLMAAATGRLSEAKKVSWSSQAAVCVVLASGGYPGPYETGEVISGLDEAASLPDVLLFHAATKRTADGSYITAGGRVIGVTALGDTIQAATKHAYAAVNTIHFPGMRFRTDIAGKALARF